MNPGRELDALVAEKVMGGNQAEATFVKGVDRDTGVVTTETRLEWPPYSTDIAAAWEVVKKLMADQCTVHITADSLHPRVQVEYVGYIADISSEAETIAHAICLAALKAVGALP